LLFINQMESFMENQANKNQDINKTEDELSAIAKDENAKAKKSDESFKSSDKKHRLGWEAPMDEQMFEPTSPANEEDSEKRSGSGN